MVIPGDRRRREPQSLLIRYLSAVGIVAASIVAAEVFYRFFDTTRLSMIFLVGVLFAAVSLGSGPAYLASVLAFFAYNFYLVEPRFSLEGISAEDVLLLIVFLAVSLLTGRLAGKVRDEERRATLRAHTTSILFQASQAFSSTGDESELCAHLVRHVAEASAGEARLVRAEGVWQAPEHEPRLAPLVAENPALRMGWRSRVLEHGETDLGTLMWRPTDSRGLGEEESLIGVIADLGVAALTRARLTRANAEIEAFAATEKLRNALLSSISHDLRTPLAAILASSTSLREFGNTFSEETKEDLLQTIEEEAERLNRMVANLLNMTRVESGALVIQCECVDVSEILDHVCQRFARPPVNRTITRSFETTSLSALVDPMLLEQALANVIENAVRFSPPGTPIVLRATAEAGKVHIEVSDEGPGVPPEELHQIFDKFYRSPAVSAVPGTGLGLSITKGLVEAMGGAVRATLRSDGKAGLVVSIMLSACGDSA